MIRLENVYFRREERQILNDVNLDIGQGEHWAILGRNGSGKTTILEMMNGYLFPSSGSLHVLNNRYGQCDVREVRKRIGYISQSLVDKLTLRDPVWEVVVTGKYGYLRLYERIPEDIIGKADDVLARVRLSHVRNQPFGTLSQGERKKVLLARALMTDPSLLILDEPCAGLDLFEREQFLASLNDIVSSGSRSGPIGELGGAGIVYVTHHIEEIIPAITHVCLLEQGRIVAAGAKRDVLTPQTLEEAFQIKAKLEWVNGRPWIQVTETL